MCFEFFQLKCDLCGNLLLLCFKVVLSSSKFSCVPCLTSPLKSLTSASKHYHSGQNYHEKYRFCHKDARKNKKCVFAGGFASPQGPGLGPASQKVPGPSPCRPLRPLMGLDGPLCQKTFAFWCIGHIICPGLDLFEEEKNGCFGSKLFKLM